MTNDGRSGSYTKGALILIGTILGGVFFYLAFRDISWHDLADGVAAMRVVYVLPCLLLYVIIQVVRSLRFVIILSPFCRVSLWDAFHVMNIWAGLNMVMPARTAEFVRPYLLQRKGASFSSTLGAVLVERIFDLMSLLALLAVVLWSTPEIPERYTFLGQALLGLLVFSYGGVLAILTYRDALLAALDRALARAPGRFSTFVGGMVRRMIEGFGIMASPKQTFVLFMYSLVIWTLFSCVTYLMLAAFSLNVQFLAAVTIQVLLCFGVALPAAPGFIGTFHAVGRYTLALFGVAAVPALSFATVYHLLNMFFCIVAAAISYFAGGYNLEKGLVRSPEEKKQAPDNMQSFLSQSQL
ncbi:MAG: lysylphosphatidylglycerol synthase transmembrane domain-containing protein [Pseudomonadota bacterium]